MLQPCSPINKGLTGSEDCMILLILLAALTCLTELSESMYVHDRHVTLKP